MGPSPAHKLIPIRSELLQPGMYVAELDRSWLHSPFPAMGFLITSPGQIEQLRQVCRYVYVDPDLSEGLPAGGSLAAGLTRPERDPGPGHESPFVEARRVLADTLLGLADIVRGARRQGVVDLGVVSRCATALVDQGTGGSEALHWYLRTDDHGSFVHRRAAGTAVVAMTLGRQIGLDVVELIALATGGLLLDIGKVAVPVPILAKPGPLEGGEQCYVRRHVERGLDLVSGRDVPERALEMIAGHHERVDGSGYPNRLRGTEIPLFARIAAIADAFDAMTLNRRYAAAMSPHAALRQLDGLRDQKFDAALVTELIHALGVYPIGTAVEIVDGSLGLVCGQRRHQPLQPHILVTHDAERQPLAEPRLAATGGGAEILRTLPPNLVHLDPARIGHVLQRLYPPAA